MPSRLLIFIAGLFGAGGVIMSAVAAHGASRNAATIASFLLMHAAVMLVIGLISFNQIMRWAALVLVCGVLLFSLDLLIRDLTDERLFAMAAPAGGTLMVLGWAGIAVSALLPRRLIG